MKIENYFDEVMNFLLAVLSVNTDSIENIKYFYRPLKEWSFLKNNKYKIVRFLSYISPWIIFPYTLLTFGIWLFTLIAVLILAVIGIICEYIFSKFNKFKTFWNNL